MNGIINLFPTIKVQRFPGVADCCRIGASETSGRSRVHGLRDLQPHHHGACRGLHRPQEWIQQGNMVRMGLV